MAKDRDTGGGDASGQSKRPPENRIDSSDQTQLITSHQHHRSKSSKHIVGGGRLHARVPSTKALHKHHATTSTTKLNRRRSLSPDQTTAPPLASTHRRTTSDLKLGQDASVASHIRKNSSQTSLKRNRSQVDVGKKSKSSTNLTRSHSNPAVHKLKSGGSRVHFNLGEDEDDAPDVEGLDDEWVDASTSASPLLSRRSSVAAGAVGTTTTTTDQPAESRSPQESRDPPYHPQQSQYSADVPAGHPGHNYPVSTQQYLTERVLQRAPSHGAPPKMTAENALVGPVSSHQHSPDSGSGTVSGSPRPGSSGKPELTSRFVGYNSQESGSGVPIENFIAGIQRGGISRAAVTGRLEANELRRPRSTGNLTLGANGTTGLQETTNGVHRAVANNEPLTDEEDVENIALATGPRARRNGGITHPTRPIADSSRVQQKLNLQRASSTLEPTHPHPTMSMRLGGVAVAPGPLVGRAAYDARDPRLGKLLERTGMEYLVVRRHQNPIARSLMRLAQLPGADKTRPIPRPGTGHSKRGSDLTGRSGLRERDTSMATLIGGQSRRPPTPRSSLSMRQTTISASSSLETEDEVRGIHERQRLSGTSLVNEDDAGTIALLRNMWDKNLDLSASQD
ncbi:hypothetical protein QBC47DRAFT_113087 [Echria macrotheca]|uniref:Uncharacterized protein n=1 Tax=Echria macrotheca TaxID=438768 RepID=A0AAJ0BM84_9PEZI|nr:hypothetical protein QBC47DRAFT_113087 [Echria macrotheca]